MDRKKNLWKPVQDMTPSTTDVASSEITSLDATFKAVKEITVTRLSSEVLTMLRQQGCVVDERGPANIQIIFPEQTQQQPLLPPTAIERYRIMLASGLELRHEVDREREMSLLAIVHFETEKGTKQ